MSFYTSMSGTPLPFPLTQPSQPTSSQSNHTINDFIFLTFPMPAEPGFPMPFPLPSPSPLSFESQNANSGSSSSSSSSSSSILSPTLETITAAKPQKRKKRKVEAIRTENPTTDNSENSAVTSAENLDEETIDKKRKAKKSAAEISKVCRIRAAETKEALKKEYRESTLFYSKIYDLFSKHYGIFSSYPSPQDKKNKHSKCIEIESRSALRDEIIQMFESAIDARDENN